MFANMKVGTRLAGAFAALVLLMVVMLVISLSQLATLENHIDSIVNDRVPKVILAERLAKNTLESDRQIRNLLLLDSSKHGPVKEKIAEVRKANAEILETLDKTISTPKGREVLNTINGKRDKLRKLYPVIFDQVDKDPAAARRTVMEEFVPASVELIKSSEDMLDLLKVVMQTQLSDAAAAYHTARNTVLGIVLFAIVLSAIIATAMVRSITRPLHQIQAAVSTVRSANDFTVSVPVSSHDEVGATAAAFNELLATLRQTLAHLKQSITQVAGASQSLVTASEQSAQASGSTSEAASSMAASVEQMSVSINQVSDNARAASELAQRAGSLSAEGGEVIGNTVAEMEHIGDAIDRVAGAIGNLGEQSQQISSIIQVIKDVADQTNLLALNAAIEAARAGEAGRGFAVVADEVRKLAERTTNATGEIATMITNIQSSSQSAVDAMRDSVAQVKSGRALAEKAGTAIVEIRRAAEDVVNVVADIADSIAEQSTASQSIAQQLEHVAQAAEENNAASDETASSANQLGELAVEMRQTTDRFKI